MKLLPILLLSTACVCSADTFLVPSNPPPRVQLAWDASPTTTMGQLTYKLYYGPGSRTYTNLVLAGTNLTAGVSNLVRGATYYFACTANATNGLESGFSNEVNYAVPAPPEPPVMKSVVVLTVQSAPTPTGNWANAGMDWTLTPDEAEKVYRLQVGQQVAPQVAKETPKLRLLPPPIPK